MPLPDERPRQSVANLIGRFENQTKRQSLPPPTASPRSTSVTSNITNDSSKEEVKEKREWPPKSTPSSEKSSPVILPSSTWSRRPLAATQQPIPPKSEFIDVLSKPLNTDPTSRLNLDTTKASLPPLEPEMSAPAPNPVATPTSNTLKSPGKIPVPTTPKSSLKPPMKTPPKQTPSAQPLRPQHTGSSTTTARKPVTKPTPTTPLRSKTPSRLAATGAKSPAPTTGGRPKTPSGLFAPTAASLAKSRNAPPLPPTPTKKTTLSSAVADRLSKPTAASLSRARTPTSPARGGAKPAVRGGATRGTPRVVSSSSTRAKKDAPSPSLPTAEAVAATATVAVAAVGIIAASESAVTPGGEQEAHSHHEDDPAEKGHSGNGHIPTESHEATGVVEELETTGHVVVSEPEVELEHEEKLEHGEGPEHEAGMLEVGEDARVVESPLPDPEELETAHAHVPDTSASSSDTQSVPEEPTDEPKLHSHVGNDIEDIVNLLESSIPNARPLSIATIPDEVHEIPDEE